MRQAVLLARLAILVAAFAASARADDEEPLLDKTLVVWASPASLTQRGGSALTVDANQGDHFDGVVFGEIEPAVWMPGSSHYRRTEKNQAHWPKETASPDDLVQVAIVYRGRGVTVYRNGEPYAEYTMGGEPYPFGPQSIVMFGPRHVANPRDCFTGRIRDARVYDRPLDRATVAAMEPGEPIPGIAPWAWWDFATTGTYERTGRFNEVKLRGDAAVEGGCLVLGENKAAMIASHTPADPSQVAAVPTQWSVHDPVPDAVVQSTRLLRERLLADPYRPGYHFCVPEDIGRPGDANGCFFARGRYHLMYLYNRNGVGFCCGHLSSQDLVHWRHHPDGIGPGDGDEGCFSGGGFLDDDGTAYLSYWMLWGDKGIGLAKSHDAHYDRWQKLEANPVVKSTEWGITEVEDADGNPLIYGSADPSNIWRKDGKYYLLTGNLPVLNKVGRKPDAPPEQQGDRLYLFESEDLATWKYRGVFYERNPEWTAPDEDNMCPSFLPLPSSPGGGAPSGKHLLLFISHNRGCQYYVGDYDTASDRFIPTGHGRMTWVDNTYFAPEALVDDRGRQIMWAWLTDNPGGEPEKGWSGVFGLPRSLWLAEDGTLGMRPVEELAMLRSGEQSWNDVTLADGETKPLDGVVGDSCELELTIHPATARQGGVKVRASPGGEEETRLYYDAAARKLVFDATRSGVDGRRVVEQAPLELNDGEPLALRVFVDKSVVEVYANDRQAICRRVYPGRDDSLGVVLFAHGGRAEFSRVKAWEMMPSNPY